MATKGGLRCPGCGGDCLRVVYTRSSLCGVVQRRRQCKDCECRVTTWEQIVPRNVYIRNDSPENEQKHGSRLPNASTAHSIE